MTGAFNQNMGYEKGAMDMRSNSYSWHLSYAAGYRTTPRLNRETLYGDRVLCPVLPFRFIDIILQSIKIALVDDLQEPVQMAEGCLKLVGRDQLVTLGVSKLIEVDHADAAVRIDDDVCQKIREDESFDTVFGRMGRLYDIAVPGYELVFMVIELAYFEAPFGEIAGITMVKRFLRVKRVPLCDDGLTVSVKKNIVLQ